MKLALFDLDHTLIPIDSDHSWGQFTVALGWRDADSFGRANDQYYDHYTAGTLDIVDYVRFTTAALREQGMEKALAARADFVRTVVQPSIHPAALELVQRHRAAGDEVIIITATNAFVTRPIADAFGVAHLIAIDLVLDSTGLPTGEVAGIPSFREGKVTRVEQWLGERGASWADVTHSTFYSDSITTFLCSKKSDIPWQPTPVPD